MGSEMESRPGPTGATRCWWCLGAPEYIDYHDRVWGQPMHGERKLFEMLVLESFQSGLSWLTILRKQDGFRGGLRRLGRRADRRLRGTRRQPPARRPGIVRHRGKIEATIANAARHALHERARPSTTCSGASRPSATEQARPKAAMTSLDDRESKAMAKELKQRGFRFVGPTTAYSLMQAAGLVNDHLGGCEFR